MKPLPEREPSSNKEKERTDVAGMVLDVAKEMEAKRKKDARERLMAAKDDENVEEDHDDMIYSLDELTRMNELVVGVGSDVDKGKFRPVQGPELSQQGIQEVVRQQKEEKARVHLAGYWQFVRENPHDFNGWRYLVEYAENMGDLVEVRAAYNAFLPLFPYCYAYWERYAEAEKKHGHWEQALKILNRGLAAIPLSLDLWTTYLELFRRLRQGREDFVALMREQCERAVADVGLDFGSSSLWER